ncbi:MAG: hypothetical protein NT054_08795 [Burkholderiales bacterium]|nr:hypothetical protein [Burkholderiales bacterium]
MASTWEPLTMQVKPAHPYTVLIFGASYGSLLATKLALAGHDATLVCLPNEVELINREGTKVRFPIKGRDGLVEVDSRSLVGKVSATTPNNVNLANYDLVVLAMQEPQYGALGVRELLHAVALAKLPTMSIMNMPPLTYLARIPGLSIADYRKCYTDPSVWDDFDPKMMTLCSPDAQAFRPADEPINVLQVRLPTNFKAARFESEEHTQMLRNLAADIEAVRFDTGTEVIELPVKLKVFDSVFVPLAKWSMLLAGNYRCITPDGMRPIKEAIHDDVELSKNIYNWARQLCQKLGASETDLVPFEKYAAAAQSLGSPSSAARALFAGAKNIERVDLLMQAVAAKQGIQSDAVDRIVDLVNQQLEKNRTLPKAA